MVNSALTDSIFSRYVNVRVMLSIVLSVLLSTMLQFIMDGQLANAKDIIPFSIFIFIMYLIIYIIEAMPAIFNWYVETFHATNKAVAR